ncbi:MAG: RNA 2',3'-cyclic phosphodiesterase [Spirochaetota bacterium]
MRVFIALPIPGSVRDTIIRESMNIRKEYPPIGWVKGEGMHITLHFLGELGGKGVQEIIRLLTTTPFTIPAFTIDFSGALKFPEKGKPRVLFLRITKGIEECLAIYDALTLLLKPFVMKTDKHFTPHITLARIKNSPAWPDVSRFQEIKGSFTVSAVVLYESILLKTGAEYRELAKADLKTDTIDNQKTRGAL